MKKGSSYPAQNGIIKIIYNLETNKYGDTKRQRISRVYSQKLS